MYYLFPRWEYQIPELLVYGWFAVMIVDELREVIMEPSRVLRSKFSDYFNSVWNKFDLFIVIFAVSSVVLKNFKATFKVGKLQPQHLFLFNYDLGCDAVCPCPLRNQLRPLLHEDIPHLPRQQEPRTKTCHFSQDGQFNTSSYLPTVLA